jgi:protein TonB
MNTASFRAVPITGGASFVTFGLFLLMQGLVGQDQIAPLEERQVFNPNIVLEDIKVNPVREIDRLPPPPEPVKVPEVEITRIPPGDGVMIDIGIGPIPTIEATGGDKIQLGYMDGERLPLVRVQPQYPRPALERGIEGSVVVEFTVREDGTVADARVIEADPKGMFDRAALAAIAKFKYKPTVVDGIARASAGIRYRFVFELTE